MKFVLWDDYLVEQFKKDRELAKGCLADAIDEWQATGDASLLIIRLKQLSLAYGVTKLSKVSGLGVRTIDNSLSLEKGNPTLKTLSPILKVLSAYCENKKVA